MQWTSAQNRPSMTSMATKWKSREPHPESRALDLAAKNPGEGEEEGGAEDRTLVEAVVVVEVRSASPR